MTEKSTGVTLWDAETALRGGGSAAHQFHRHHRAMAGTQRTDFCREPGMLTPRYNMTANRHKIGSDEKTTKNR